MRRGKIGIPTNDNGDANMGIRINSLVEIPKDAERGFFVYLLHGNTPTRINQALEKSFDILAKEASQSNFVVVMGYTGEFGGEVMNHYSVDGLDSYETLPAILISTVNPHQFKDINSINKGKPFRENEKVVLISLKQKAQTEDDVFNMVTDILRDLKSGTELRNFAVTQDKKTNFLDALILEPNLSGVGINLNSTLSNYENVRFLWVISNVNVSGKGLKLLF